MKKRIFAIALIMLFTLSMLVPISVSAEEITETASTNDVVTILGGKYEVKKPIKQSIDNITDIETWQQYFGNFNEYLYDFEYYYYPVNGEAGKTLYTTFFSYYADFICEYNGVFVSYNSYHAMGYFVDDAPNILCENGSYEIDGDLSINTSDSVLSYLEFDTQTVDRKVYNWIFANTNYDDYWNPEDDFEDLPEIEYTLSSGTYVFNETMVMPSNEIIQDFSDFFIVTTIDNTYNGMRMKATSTSLSYNLNGTMTTVYNSPPLANAGWQNIGYRSFTILKDETVSKEFYEFVIENTTPPVVVPPNYEFADDGIYYQDTKYATYENDDTKRIVIDGHYCVMFKNDTSSNVFVFTATESLRLGTSTIKTKSGQRLEYWTIENGVISYSGDKVDFAIPHTWIAGNHEILNWSSDTVYQSFDTGMTVFRETPQMSPSLVEMMAQIPMTGAMREILVLLPVCLTLLISYLALRKGLEICRQTLFKA